MRHENDWRFGVTSTVRPLARRSAHRHFRSTQAAPSGQTTCLTVSVDSLARFVVLPSSDAGQDRESLFLSSPRDFAGASNPVLRQCRRDARDRSDRRFDAGPGVRGFDRTPPPGAAPAGVRLRRPVHGLRRAGQRQPGRRPGQLERRPAAARPARHCSDARGYATRACYLLSYCRLIRAGVSECFSQSEKQCLRQYSVMSYLPQPLTTICTECPAHDGGPPPFNQKSR